jgi:hypothetical protein
MFVPCISNIKIPLLKSNQCTLLVASTLKRHHRRSQKTIYIYSFSQELRNSLKMVPAWTETCWSVYCELILILFRVDATSNVHWLDFNKGILIPLIVSYLNLVLSNSIMPALYDDYQQCPHPGNFTVLTCICLSATFSCDLGKVPYRM